jgi:hypothetical protein
MELVIKEFLGLRVLSHYSDGLRADRLWAHPASYPMSTWGSSWG